MQYQQDKFINALLFFGKETNPKVFGITKLLKLLFLSDFWHFKKYGRPILGDTYFRLPQGPVPSISYNLFADLSNINKDTDLRKVARIIPEKVGNYDLQRIEPLREPNVNVFSKSDIEIMERIAKRFRDSNASSMVKKIHDVPFVKDTPKGVEVDYKLVLENEDDRIYAESLEKEEGVVGVLASV